MRPFWLTLLLLMALLVRTAALAAPAERPDCRIEPIQGATSAQGAVAQIHRVNDGRPCGITNFGVPAERANPADSGSITQKPAHGSALFIAPQARYTPERGYVGADEFEYEAFAKGSHRQSVRLKIRVEVTVTAP